MVDRGAATAPFGESSYFFGTQHPGQAAQVPAQLGRPAKLFKEIARVIDTDYEAFRTRRDASDGGDRGQG